MRFGFVNGDGGFGPYDSLKDLQSRLCSDVCGTTLTGYLNVKGLVEAGYEIVPMEEEKDMINPDHYKVHANECIDEIQAMLTPEEFKGFLKGNFLKYRYRTGHKDDPEQEAKKSDWYMNKLMEVEKCI